MKPEELKSTYVNTERFRKKKKKKDLQCSFVFIRECNFYPGLKTENILKHSLHFQLTLEREMINVIT